MKYPADIVRVGILIPTYNRLEYLKKTIQSAQGQLFRDVEIVVIDNGSCDGTDRYMAELDDHRILYVVNEQNLGLIGSINRGVRQFSAEVKWATILPDDDLLDEAFVASMVSKQVELSANTVLHGKCILVNSEGRVIREAIHPPAVESAYEYLNNRARHNTESFLTGLFFSISAFEEIGGYPRFTTGMATDDAFIFALAMRGSFYFNPDAAAFVRVHPEAESQQSVNGINHIQALLDFKRYIMYMAGLNNLCSEILYFNLERVVISYVSRLASSLWIRNVKYLSKTKPENFKKQLDAFLQLVDENTEMEFTCRVRASAYLTKITGQCPEGYFLYRAPWELIKRLACGRRADENTL